ncbi:MAG: hypothetical protein KKH44_00385 [Bacteroidetes bacterium]|nr:hypothetical protein [Bacteroidota bacterium]
MPDYQGIGIGRILSDYIAAAYKTLYFKNKYTRTTSLLFWANKNIKNPNWRKTKNFSITSHARKSLNTTEMRATISFEYIGKRISYKEASLLITEIVKH